MSIDKALQQKQKHHAETRVFIRLHMSEAVARGASHIRSKRPASLQAGIDEVRREYAADFGEDTVAAFLECIALWLTDRNNTVAAAALRLYMENTIHIDPLPSRLDEFDEDTEPTGALDALGKSAAALGFPLVASTVSMFAADDVAASADASGARHATSAAAARRRAGVVASRAGLRAPRLADNGPATHSYRSSRSR